MKKNYKQKIGSLEKELAICHAKIIEITEKLARTKESNKEELNKAMESRQGTLNTVKALEMQVSDLQDKQNEIFGLKQKLQGALAKKVSVIKDLEIRNMESKSKVTEAVQVVQAALLEKDAALLREKQAIRK